MRETIQDVIAILAVIACVVIPCYAFYKAGYDQGRNDGFKSGWREAIEAKELPEPPTEDE